jgi:hypothetical protein
MDSTKFINPFWATVVPPHARCSHPLTLQPPPSPSCSSSDSDVVVTPPTTPPAMSREPSPSSEASSAKPRTPLPNIQAGVAERANLAQMEYLLKKLKNKSPSEFGKRLDHFVSPLLCLVWYGSIC